MGKAKDTLEWVRDISLILFGYVGFLYQIYLWSEKSTTTTLVFGILLAIILFLAGLIPNLKKASEEG